MQENIAASKRDLEAGSLQLADELAGSSLNLLENGNFELAEPVLREVLLVRKERIPESWKTYDVLSMLGVALLGQGRLQDAEPLLLEAYQGFEQIEASIPAVGQIRFTEALERLVALYQASGNAEAAERWQQQLSISKRSK